MPARPIRSVTPAASESSDTPSAAELDVTARALQSYDNNPAAQKYLSSLADAQRRLDAANQANIELSNKLADIDLQNQQPRRRDPPSEAAPSGNKVFDKKAISRAGTYAQLFYIPVLDTSAFAPPKPSFSPEDPARYESKESQIAGQSADIYASFGAEHHSSLKLPVVSQLFPRALASGLANALKRLREKAHLIFSVSTAEYPGAFNLDFVRSEIPILKGYLGAIHVAVKQADGTTKQVAHYPDYPPLLFPPDKIGNMAHIFLNPMLITIARVVIYGPSTLTGGKSILRAGGQYAHDDGRTLEATSGLIAWTAMIATFLASDDKGWGNTGTGGVTGMKYLDRHADYRKLLIEGRSNTANIQRIFRIWNEALFPLALHAAQLDAEVSEPAPTAPVEDVPRRLTTAEVLAMVAKDVDDDGPGEWDEYSACFVPPGFRPPRPVGSEFWGYSQPVEITATAGDFEHIFDSDPDEEVTTPAADVDTTDRVPDTGSATLSTRSTASGHTSISARAAVVPLTDNEVLAPSAAPSARSTISGRASLSARAAIAPRPAVAITKSANISSGSSAQRTPQPNAASGSGPAAVAEPAPRKAPTRGRTKNVPGNLVPASANAADTDAEPVLNKDNIETAAPPAARTRGAKSRASKKVSGGL